MKAVLDIGIPLVAMLIMIPVGRRSITASKWAGV
jgi:hypothetical protein